MYQVNFGTEAVAAGGCVQRCHCYLEVKSGRGSSTRCILVCGCCRRGWVKVHTGLVALGFRSENHGFLAASQFTLYIL